MFENPMTGRQARNFTTNVSKILDLKSSSEQIFFRKLSLGAPVLSGVKTGGEETSFFNGFKICYIDQLILALVFRFVVSMV